MPRLLAAFFLALLIPMTAFADLPPVFDTRPYAEAKKAAADDKKWFIVKATAEWCGPCKQMDKTTWRDEKVVKWLKSNAVVVALDVDKEQKLAQTLGIQAMPTMVAFKDDKEFDRVVGYKTPGDFIVWLEGMAKGEKSIEAVKRRAAPGAGGKSDMRARMTLARSLVSGGELDKATEEYAWLWDNMLDHQPAMVGVRSSFMAVDMASLARQHPGAMTKFTQLRDREAKELEKEKMDVEVIDDWIVLNEIIGDEKGTLAWFDKVKAQPRWRPVIERSAFRLERLLIKKDRWADLGSLYADPIASLERSHEIMSISTRERGHPPGIPEHIKKEIDEMPVRMFRESTARLYAGLLAAKREDDAAKFAARASELDDNPGMIAALVRTAIEANQPRKQHVDWATKAAKKDRSLDDLPADVEAALKKTPTPPPDKK